MKMGAWPCTFWNPALSTPLCAVLHVNSIVNTLTPLSFPFVVRPSSLSPSTIHPSHLPFAFIQKSKKNCPFLFFPLLPILSSLPPFSHSSTSSFVLFPLFPFSFIAFFSSFPSTQPNYFPHVFFFIPSLAPTHSSSPKTGSASILHHYILPTPLLTRYFYRQPSPLLLDRSQPSSLFLSHLPSSYSLLSYHIISHRPPITYALKMRLILRTLVVFALTGTHIQRAFGQPTTQATTTDAILTKTPGASPTGQPSSSSPVPSGGMAYAFDGKYLFILGGQAKGNNVPQFFTLDLTSSWPADKPAWTPRKPPNGAAGQWLAGGLFPDKRFLVTSNGENNLFNTNVYSVDAAPDPIWSPQVHNELFLGVPGPVVATDISRETVYMYLRDNGNSTGRFHVFTRAGPDSLKDNNASISVDFQPSAVSWSNFNDSLLMTYNQKGNNLEVGLVPFGDTTLRPIMANGDFPNNRTGHCFVPSKLSPSFVAFALPNNVMINSANRDRLYMLLSK